MSAERERAKPAAGPNATSCRDAADQGEGCAVRLGSQFKGYEDVVVQDLRIQVDVVLYRREHCKTPDAGRRADRGAIDGCCQRTFAETEDRAGRNLTETQATLFETDADC
jgi:hypothetical protein